MVLILLSDFKTYYKATSQCGIRERADTQKMEQKRKPRIDPCKHGHLIFGKGGKAAQWSKDSTFSTGSWGQWGSTRKNVNLSTGLTPFPKMNGS